MYEIWTPVYYGVKVCSYNPLVLILSVVVVDTEEARRVRQCYSKLLLGGLRVCGQVLTKWKSFHLSQRKHFFVVSFPLL